MMILYFDTSALVKRYFREPYSDVVLAKWQLADQIVTSAVAYAETMAAMHRKKREEGLEDTFIRQVDELFHRDWESFIRVLVNEELNVHIDRVVERFSLRGFDAIHLASALVIRERLSEQFIFACFDEILARAAQMEGFETFPPSDI